MKRDINIVKKAKHYIDCMKSSDSTSEHHRLIVGLLQEVKNIPQWQPIETLHFSNDIVLFAVQFHGDGDWRIKCGVKDAHEDNGFLIWGASWTPTHWMPLPAPPVIESI